MKTSKYGNTKMLESASKRIIRNYIKTPLLSLLLIGILWVLYYFLFHQNPTFPPIGFMFKLRVIVYSILFPVLWIIIGKRTPYFKLRINSLNIILSVVLACFITVGISEFIFNDLRLCCGNAISCIIWGIQIVILGILFLPIVEYIVSFIINYRPKPINKKFNLFIFGFITVGIRLLFLVIYFPAIFDFDAGFGLRTMLDPTEIVTNHHPYGIQWIHSIFFKFGQGLGNPAIGIGVLTTLFILISSAIILYAVKTMIRMKIGYRLLRLAAYTLSVFPFFIIMSLYCTKDGFFAYGFLFYQTVIINIFQSNGKCFRSLSFQILSFLSILLVCLTRHQGIYIVLIESLVLLFVWRKEFWRTLLSLLPGIAIIIIFNNFILPSINVGPIDKKESNGMFFQQTARYLKDNPREITNNERQAIQVILPIDTIVNSYQYNNIDNVKKYYAFQHGDYSKNDNLLHFKVVNHAGESDALKNYRKAWLNMGLRHPLSYIDATLGVASAYFFNNGNPIVTFDYAWSNSQATIPKYAFEQHDRVIELTSKIVGYCSNTPILDILFGLPFYLYVSIFLIGIILYQKNYKGLIIFFPIILSIGILFLTPVAAGRYIWPITIAIPLLFMYIIKTNHLNYTS